MLFSAFQTFAIFTCLPFFLEAFTILRLKFLAFSILSKNIPRFLARTSNSNDHVSQNAHSIDALFQPNSASNVGGGSAAMLSNFPENTCYSQSIEEFICYRGNDQKGMCDVLQLCLQNDSVFSRISAGHAPSVACSMLKSTA